MSTKAQKPLATRAEITRLESVMFETPPCQGCCDPECSTFKSRLNEAKEAAASAPAMGLKKCSSCWRFLVKSEYSGSQLKLKGHRKCKLCVQDFCNICGRGAGECVQVPFTGESTTLGSLHQLQILRSPTDASRDVWVTIHPKCVIALSGVVTHPTKGSPYPHKFMTGADTAKLELLQHDCTYCRRRGAMFLCTHCSREAHGGCFFNYSLSLSGLKCHTCANEEGERKDKKKHHATKSELMGGKLSMTTRSAMALWENLILGDDEAVQLESIKLLNHLFRHADDELQQLAIESRAVSRLLQLLQSRSLPLQLHCARYLSNLTLPKVTSTIGVLVSAGVLPILVTTMNLACTSVELQEVCLHVVTNISMEKQCSVENNRAIFETDILQILFALSAPSTSFNIVSVVGRLLFSLSMSEVAPCWHDLSIIIRAAGTILLHHTMITAADIEDTKKAKAILLRDCLGTLKAAVEMPIPSQYKEDRTATFAASSNSHKDGDRDSVCVHIRFDTVLDALPDFPVRAMELLSHSDQGVVTVMLQLLSSMLEQFSKPRQATLLTVGIISKLTQLLSHKLPKKIRTLSCLVMSKVARGFPEHARILASHTRTIHELVLILTKDTDKDLCTEACHVLSSISIHSHQSGSETITGLISSSSSPSETKEGGDSGKDDYRDLVCGLVNEHQVIAPLISRLRDSKQCGRYDLMRAATEVLGHVLDTGIVESKYDDRGVNPYIEAIDWLGAFELWDAERDNVEDLELSKEAARLFDTFFIPNTCE